MFFFFFLSAFKTAFFVFVRYGLTFTNLPIPKPFFCLKNKTALIPSFTLLLKIIKIIIVKIIIIIKIILIVIITIIVNKHP